MGIDISVGDPKSKDYISEKLGSATSVLIWKHKIVEKEGINFYEGYNGKFKLALIHKGDCYTIKQLPTLLKQLREIKKLNIEDYDTIIEFDNSDGMMKYIGKKTLKSANPTIDKFIRVCEIAIKRNLPIKISF